MPRQRLITARGYVWRWFIRPRLECIMFSRGRGLVVASFWAGGRPTRGLISREDCGFGLRSFHCFSCSGRDVVVVDVDGKCSNACWICTDWVISVSNVIDDRKSLLCMIWCACNGFFRVRFQVRDSACMYVNFIVFEVKKSCFDKLCCCFSRSFSFDSCFIVVNRFCYTYGRGKFVNYLQSHMN